MKFSLSWLKQHLETDLDLAELTKAMTNLGLSVEKVIDRRAELAPFVVAQITEAAPHPNADRLRVCQVQTATEVLQIVCGAPNARAGIKVVLAPIGTVMPQEKQGVDQKEKQEVWCIKASKIRGVMSNGMLCSARELLLGEDQDGIIEVDHSLEIGKPYAATLELDDPLIEVSVTPNRGDCFSVRGIARDLAVAGYGKLKEATAALKILEILEPLEPPTLNLNKITISDTKACPLFAMIEIDQVKNLESPSWLKKRLAQAGARSVNAIVDVTNYVMYDRGQPLHAYDRSKVSGDIKIEYGESQQVFKALNQQDYVINNQCLIVKDDGRADIMAPIMALGGVMGGASSACDAETKSVLLEAAYFAPSTVAYGGQFVGLTSESRMRFERGVDPEQTLASLYYAAQLISEITKAKIVGCSKNVPNYTIREKIAIKFDVADYKRLIGEEISSSEAQQIMERLGCEIRPLSSDNFSVKAGMWFVYPPSWRYDLRESADLVEELLRIKGYNNLGSTPFERTSSQKISFFPTVIQNFYHQVRKTLSSYGAHEVVNLTFVPEKLADLFSAKERLVALANPLSQDLTHLRPSLFPNLLSKVVHNLNHGQENVSLFEIGPQFALSASRNNKKNNIWEVNMVAGIGYGKLHERHWQISPPEYDLYEAKAAALAVLELGVGAKNLESIKFSTDNLPSYYHPGRAMSCQLGEDFILGYIGELHPSVLQQFGIQLGIKARACGFEINLDELLKLKTSSLFGQFGKYSQPLYPEVKRDFAFVVNKFLPTQEVQRLILELDKNLISKVHIFDVYHGSGIGVDKKSVALEVTLAPKDKTLTEEEINSISQLIIKSVEEKLEGTLRSI